MPTTGETLALVGGGLLASEATGLTDVTPIGRNQGGGQNPPRGTLPPGLGLPPELLSLLLQQRGNLPPGLARQIAELQGQVSGLAQSVNQRRQSPFPPLLGGGQGRIPDIPGAWEAWTGMPPILPPDRINWDNIPWANPPDGGGGSDGGGAGAGGGTNPFADGFDLQDLRNTRQGLQPGDVIAAGGETGAAAGSAADDVLGFVERGGAGWQLLLSGRTIDPRTGEELVLPNLSGGIFGGLFGTPSDSTPNALTRQNVLSFNRNLALNTALGFGNPAVGGNTRKFWSNVIGTANATPGPTGGSSAASGTQTTGGSQQTSLRKQRRRRTVMDSSSSTPDTGSTLTREERRRKRTILGGA